MLAALGRFQQTHFESNNHEPIVSVPRRKTSEENDETVLAAMTPSEEDKGQEVPLFEDRNSKIPRCVRRASGASEAKQKREENANPKRNNGDHGRANEQKARRGCRK